MGDLTAREWNRIICAVNAKQTAEEAGLKTDEELQQTQTEFRSLLKELTSPDEKIMSSLNNLIEKMEGR